MKPQDPRAEAAAASPVWPGLEKSPSKRRHHIAWVVLTISLAASTVGWFISLKLQDQASAQLLGTEAASVRAVLQERLAVYENVLHGACGLFAASVSVERKEWRAYLDRVAIEDRFPGINALGFMACVRRPDLERFVQEARADGMPDFEVHPAGNGEELFVVKYLEPQERQRQIIGFDMTSDPERRAVAEASRDSGRATISSLMKLAEQDGGAEADGFLMLLPVYRQGAITDTVEQRRANCEGFVYARFMMKQLMAEVLERGRLPLRVRVLDRSVSDVDQSIFDTGTADPEYEPIWMTRGGCRSGDARGSCGLTRHRTLTRSGQDG